MAGRLHTPLCDLLGIRYPIFCAGIGGAARPELAAAVSNAGGFGVLGCGGFPTERIVADVAKTRELTTRPFGVNLIIDSDGTDEDARFLLDQAVTAAALRPAALALFWGDPAAYVAPAHEQGVKVLVQVGSLDEARAAAEAGVDAVIAQGVEAGGHVRGTSSIWDLLPDVVRALRPLPVLASGGIGDGAGVARALEFGAQGVSLGTRFVASNEAFALRAYKERIVESKAEDTVLNTLYDVWWPNAPHRTLKNKTYAEWVAAGKPPPGSRPREGVPIGLRVGGSGALVEWPRYAIGVVPPGFDGDWEYAPLWAGESCSDINEIKPAGELVRDLVRDAEAALTS